MAPGAARRARAASSPGSASPGCEAPPGRSAAPIGFPSPACGERLGVGADPEPGGYAEEAAVVGHRRLDGLAFGRGEGTEEGCIHDHRAPLHRPLPDANYPAV